MADDAIPKGRSPNARLRRKKSHRCCPPAKVSAHGDMFTPERTNIPGKPGHRCKMKLAIQMRYRYGSRVAHQTSRRRSFPCNTGQKTKEGGIPDGVSGGVWYLADLLLDHSFLWPNKVMAPAIGVVKDRPDCPSTGVELGRQAPQLKRRQCTAQNTGFPHRLHAAQRHNMDERLNISISAPRRRRGLRMGYHIYTWVLRRRDSHRRKMRIAARGSSATNLDRLG